MSLDLMLRPMREDERSYVLSSWIRSYAQKSADARAYDGMTHEAFARDYAPVVRNLVARSELTVACWRDEPEMLVGWMAWEGSTLHYVCTKPSFRRAGVAKWMLSGHVTKAVAYTHETNDSRRGKVPSAWHYRRWLIWPAEETAA